MSTERDVTRIVRSWLEEGATALPDRVLDAVLDQVPATPQRRSWWPAWRLSEMNNALKLVIATAAVVVVAIVGINLLPRSGGIGGTGPSPTTNPTPAPTPTQTPTRSPSPSPSPGELPVGSLVAGTTYVIDDPVGVGSQRIFLTVPAGWEAIDTLWVYKNVLGGGDFDLGVFPSLIGGVHADPCRWQGSSVDPPVGPTVADLAFALAAQAGSSSPTDVTVGGHPAKKVELVIPDGIDKDACDDGDYGRWFFGDDRTTKGPFTYVNGQHDTVYILDLDGTRQVIDTMYVPGTSAANLAELDQIIASIRFEPRASSPTPSP